MNNIIKKIGVMFSALFFLLAVTSSCTKDYVEPEFKTRSFSVYASFMNHSNGGANIDPTYMAVNSIEGMMDISQGFNSHEWSFWVDENMSEENPSWKQLQDNESICFLRKNCGLGYGSLSDYTPYIDNNLKPTNSQDNLVFLFNKWGRYKARIRNVYDTQIEYMFHLTDTIYKGEVNKYIKATPLENGKFEIVRDYVFELYDTLDVKAKVYEDLACSKEIDINMLLKSDSTLSVAKGKTLYFRDATGTCKYNSGTEREWNWKYSASKSEIVPTPTPTVTPSASTDSIASFTFDNEGRYTVSLKVIREKGLESIKVPTATRTKTIPIYVKVQ